MPPSSTDAPPSPARVVLESFRVRVGSALTTAPLDWRLEAGDFGLLEGGIGTGKSLVLESLVGVLRPGLVVSGNVQLEPHVNPIRRSAGPAHPAWVPQDSRLVALGTDRVGSLLGVGWRRSHGSGWLSRLLGRRGPSGADELDVLLERLGLSPRRALQLELRELSSGERHRVLLARALLEKNPLLIYDGLGEELDPSDARRVSALLREHLTAGGIVLAAARRHPQLELPDPRRATLDGVASRPRPLARKRDDPPVWEQPEPLLRIEHLRVARGRRAIGGRARGAYPIDGVSLEVAAGEVVVVLGASGSGKSTLLEAVAGLIAPREGRMRWRGRSLFDARRLIRRRQPSIQLVFQDAGQVLGDERTVRQHLESAARLSRRLKRTRRAEPSVDAATWLERLGLPARLLDLATDHLSAGEAQRVHFGRSLALDPELVLLDAPRVGGIDADEGELVSLTLARKEQGRSFLVATSDPRVAESLADRLVVLHAGRVMESGPARELLRSPCHPATVALLAGRPTPAPEHLRPAPGCPFVGACPRAGAECESEMPRLLPAPSRPAAEGRRVACFHPLP